LTFFIEFNRFEAIEHGYQPSTVLASFVKHLSHLKTSISEQISCFEDVEPSRQSSASMIQSIRTTREQPVDPQIRVRVFRVRVRVD
jgi:hypothetical protein